MFNRLILLLLFISSAALANTVSCTSDSGISERTITVPLGAIKSTVSTVSGGGDYAQYIYKFSEWFSGDIKLNCSSSDNAVTPALRKAFIISNSGQNPITISSDLYERKIYPTSVEGIGVSFNYTSGMKPLDNLSAPTILSGIDINGSNTWTDRLEIVLWKLPSFKYNQTADSKYRLNDRFQFVHAVTLNDASSSYSSVPYPSSELSNSWTVNRVNLQLTGEIEVLPDTCNFQNKTVWMGNHPFSAGNQPSAWKDASFTVTCTKGWGMGAVGMYDDNHNLISESLGTTNWGYIVQIIPYTSVIDNTNGIIALKSGGAEGYGLQLAWGKPGTQPASGQPTVPVVFDAPLYGFMMPGEIGFEAIPYGVAPAKEFNMAARFVRLDGESASPGKAEASIEVVVSYL